MAINSITGNTLLTSGSFPPVRAASTGAPLNPSTGGLLVVDGVQLVVGDRVLCKDEALAINNGIYAASTGPWTRTTDATGNTQFFSGMAVTVALGAVNAGQTFICTTTDDPVVVGTSLITFVSQSVVATATQSATSTTSLAIGTR
jgi:phage-related tail fiber protein